MLWILEDGTLVDTEREVRLAKKSGDGFFVLQRHWWRGQVVIRFGPSTEHYDLRLKYTDGHVLHVLLKDDPRQAGEVAAYLKPMDSEPLIHTTDGRTLNAFDVRGVVELKNTPGDSDSANPTKATPAFLETVAYGPFSVNEDSEDFKKWSFLSSDFHGQYRLAREDPKSSFWSFGEARGPRVQKGDVKEDSRTVRLFKADKMQQIVWGVVMEPDETDAQGHYATTGEIAEALHYFMLNWQLMDEEHARVVPRGEAAPVEAFQAPIDIEWPVDDEGNTEHVKAGSWVMATKIFSAELWKKYLRGELNAYSIRGWGKLRE